MSLSADDRVRGVEPLTKDNFLVWIEHIKDYILALDCEGADTIWEAYEWAPQSEPPEPEYDDDGKADPDTDPALGFNALPSSSATQRKFKQKHAQAFAFIRRSLSSAIFEKTIGHKTNVPLLLRMLRDCWSDNSSQDRDRLRTTYDNMRLTDFTDMDAFITTFNNHVSVMRNHNMGLVANDEDVLFAFNKTLPSAWNIQKEVSSAASHGLKQAQAYYLKAAAKDDSLPGTTHSFDAATGVAAVELACMVTDLEGSVRLLVRLRLALRAPRRAVGRRRAGAAQRRCARSRRWRRGGCQ